MNPYSSLTDSLQGQLDNFMSDLEKSHNKYTSTPEQSKRRGGEKGEIIPSGYRRGKLKNFTPEQMDLYQRLIDALGPDSYLARLAAGDEDLFNEMEAPSLRKFNELQGNLSSRFSGMGMGARNSSGFQNTANQYASDFAQDLASKRQELMRQATLDLQGMSRDLLGQKPYENYLIKKQYPQQQPDQSGDLMGGLISGATGAAAGYATGGPAGAVTGGGSGFYKGYTGRS